MISSSNKPVVCSYLGMIGTHDFPIGGTRDALITNALRAIRKKQKAAKSESHSVLLHVDCFGMVARDKATNLGMFCVHADDNFSLHSSTKGRGKNRKYLLVMVTSSVTQCHLVRFKSSKTLQQVLDLSSNFEISSTPVRTERPAVLVEKRASILNIEFGTPVVATPPCKKASFFGPRSSSLDNLGRQRPRNEMRLKNAGDAKPSGSLIQLPVEAPVESSSDPTFSPIPAAKPSVGPGPPAEKSPAAQPSSSAEECNPPGAPVVAKAAESSSIAVEAVSVAAPAGPRRRKLVRGANNIEQKVLPELTDAVIALESLDDFLDVAYSEIGKSKESNKNDLEHSSIADSHGKEAGSNTQTAKPDDDVIIVEKSAAEVAEVDAHKVQIVQNTVDPKESLPAMQNEPVAQDDRHSPSQPSTVVKTEESITVFCEHGETHLEPDQVPEPIATDNGAEKGAKSRKDNETAFPTNAMESKQVDANPIEWLTRTENIGALEKKKEKWTERLSLVLGRLDDYSAADSFMHTRNDASVGDCNSGCEVIDTIFQMSKSDVGDIDVGGDDGVSEIETGAAISGAEGSESNKPPPRAEKLVPRSNDSIDGPDKTDTEDEGVASWRGEAFSKDAGVFSKGKKAFPNAQGAECRVDRAGLGVDDATPPKTCNDEVLSTTAVPPAESEDVPAYNDAQTLDDGNLSIGSADSDTPCFAAATPSQADCSACGRFCFEFAGRMLYTASDEIVCGIEWNDGLYGEEVDTYKNDKLFKDNDTPLRTHRGIRRARIMRPSASYRCEDL